MQLFLGGLDGTVGFDDLFQYFSKFGTISELKIISDYGFVTFKDEDAARVVLQEKSHTIKECSVNVEESGKKRTKQPFKREVFDRRDKYESTSRYPNNQYESQPRHRGSFDEFSYQPKRQRSPYHSDPRDSFPSSSCDYCRRCPRHGVFEPRFDQYEQRAPRHNVHSGDIRKIVISNIPFDCENEDLTNFVKSCGFIPQYVKIPYHKKFGIVELQTMKDKEEALINLNGRKFHNNPVTVREFYTSPRRPGENQREFDTQRDFKEENLENDSNVQKDKYYGDIDQDQDSLNKDDEKKEEEKMEL